MKSCLAVLLLIATSLVAPAAPRKELVPEAAIVPRAQLAAIAANPEAPLPPTATYDILQFDEPAFLVVRIKDNSGGVAVGELEVKIDRSTVDLRVNATLRGKSFDYFIPLGFGFAFPMKREGPAPVVTTRWKSMNFK